MPTPTKVDQVTQGLDRLLEQFKGKPNIEGQLTAYLSQNDDIESAIFQIIEGRRLDTAVGVQLDQIGSIVGQARNGLSDEEYRVQIKFKIAVNNSQGTPEELITMLATATNSTEVRYFEHYPASYMISYNGDSTPEGILGSMQDATPSSINIGIMHDSEGFGWVPAEIGALGIDADRGVLPEIGDTTGYLPVELYSDGLGGATPTPPVVDLTGIFSVDLYQGNGDTNTITNGIDLLNNDGMLLSWTTTGTNNYVNQYSSAFGSVETINPATDIGYRRWRATGNTFYPLYTMNYLSNGYGMDSTTSWNLNGTNYVNTSIRQASGFMDIVTWTGDGQARQEVPHSLGKEVSLLIFGAAEKAYPNTNMWMKGMPSDQVLTAAGSLTAGAVMAGSSPTSTIFTVGDISGNESLNRLGTEYIAYVFADDPAVGITCGSYVGTGSSGQEVDIGSRVGMLMIRNFSTSGGVINTYKTGVQSKTINGSAPTLGQISAIDVDDTKVLLGASNTFTNAVGVTNYWFNIARPT